MTKYNQFLIGLALLIGTACSNESLDDYYGTGNAPSVTTSEVILNGYKLSVKGQITDNGGSAIIEAGVCFNEVVYGEPSHENENTKIVQVSSLSAAYDLTAELLPERQYNVCAYAVNAFGKSYGEVKQLTTGVVDYELLIPGTYVARRQMSYFSWTSTKNYYEDYTVTVSIKEGKLMLEGLGCAPLKWNPGSVSLNMELNHVVTDTTDFHEIRLPLQMTDVKVEKDNRIYPVLIFSSEWMLYGESTDSKDITGKLLMEDTVVLDFETGFTFSPCDPITHEIDVESRPLDVVVGPLCFEIKNEEDLERSPKCRLYKIN